MQTVTSSCHTILSPKWFSAYLFDCIIIFIEQALQHGISCAIKRLIPSTANNEAIRFSDLEAKRSMPYYYSIHIPQFGAPA